MARIRSIHPGLFTDEAFMSLTIDCPLAVPMLLGLWVEADDAGVFEWKPLTLKARILPAAPVDARVLLEALVAAGFVQSYEHDGRQLGVIRNFVRYQRPKDPKDVHPASDEMRSYAGFMPGAIRPNAGTGRRPSAHSSEQLPNSPGTASEDQPQRKEEGGRREGESNHNQRQPLPPREEAAAVDWQDLKAKCAEIVPKANGFSVVERWAADGLDLDRAMALVREIGADMRQRGKPAQSLVAFDKAVRDRTRQPKAAFRPASVPMVNVPKDSPDWPRAAAAWAAERGKPPPVVNGGWAFPAHMLDNTKH